jgi:hypothetical protein
MTDSNPQKIPSGTIHVVGNEFLRNFSNQLRDYANMKGDADTLDKMFQVTTTEKIDENSTLLKCLIDGGDVTKCPFDGDNDAQAKYDVKECPNDVKDVIAKFGISNDDSYNTWISRIDKNNAEDIQKNQKLASYLKALIYHNNKYNHYPSDYLKKLGKEGQKAKNVRLPVNAVTNVNFTGVIPSTQLVGTPYLAGLESGIHSGGAIGGIVTIVDTLNTSQLMNSKAIKALINESLESLKRAGIILNPRDKAHIDESIKRLERTEANLTKLIKLVQPLSQLLNRLVGYTGRRDPEVVTTIKKLQSEVDRNYVLQKMRDLDEVNRCIRSCTTTIEQEVKKILELVQEELNAKMTGGSIKGIRRI